MKFEGIKVRLKENATPVWQQYTIRDRLKRKVIMRECVKLLEQGLLEYCDRDNNWNHAMVVVDKPEMENATKEEIENEPELYMRMCDALTGMNKKCVVTKYTESTNVEDAAADNESIAVEVKENYNNSSINNNNSSISNNNSNISNNNSLGENNNSVGSNSNNNNNKKNNSDRNSKNSVSFKSELVGIMLITGEDLDDAGTVADGSLDYDELKEMHIKFKHVEKEKFIAVLN
eukprot:Awhi_evm1s1480